MRSNFIHFGRIEHEYEQAIRVGDLAAARRLEQLDTIRSNKIVRYRDRYTFRSFNLNRSGGPRPAGMGG